MYKEIKLLAGFVLCLMVSLPAQADDYEVVEDVSHSLEQLILTCGAQLMIIDAVEEVGLNAEPLLQILPSECATVFFDSPENFNEANGALRGSLPRIVTETETYYRNGLRVTLQIKVYFYRCGESVCFKVLSLKRRCGGQCWYPLPLPPPFSLPTEIYPEQDGWSCIEVVVQEDPYEEVRTCVNDDGTICVTVDGETECYKGGKKVDVPEDLPPLYPGYNEPPAPESGSHFHAHGEQQLR